MQNKSGMCEKEAERIVRLTETGMEHAWLLSSAPFKEIAGFFCPPLLVPMKEKNLVMEQIYPAVSRLLLVNVAVSLPPLQHRRRLVQQLFLSQF